MASITFDQAFQAASTPSSARSVVIPFVTANPDLLKRVHGGTTILHQLVASLNVLALKDVIKIPGVWFPLNFSDGLGRTLTDVLRDAPETPQKRSMDSFLNFLQEWDHHCELAKNFIDTENEKVWAWLRRNAQYCYATPPSRRWSIAMQVTYYGDVGFLDFMLNMCPRSRGMPPIWEVRGNDGKSLLDVASMKEGEEDGEMDEEMLALAPYRYPDIHEYALARVQGRPYTVPPSAATQQATATIAVPTPPVANPVAPAVVPIAPIAAPVVALVTAPTTAPAPATAPAPVAAPATSPVTASVLPHPSHPDLLEQVRAVWDRIPVASISRPAGVCPIFRERGPLYTCSRDCNHAFSSDALSQYFAATLHSGPFPLRCPKCKAEATDRGLVTRGPIKALVEAEVIDRHDGERILVQQMRNVADEASLDLQYSMSKPCPYCATPIAHYKGHGPHHIRPGGGCPSCSHHFCYTCLSSHGDGMEWLGCPNDDPCDCFEGCDCPLCPDCTPGNPCDACSGSCPKCR